MKEKEMAETEKREEEQPFENWVRVALHEELSLCSIAEKEFWERNLGDPFLKNVKDAFERIVERLSDDMEFVHQHSAYGNQDEVDRFRSSKLKPPKHSILAKK